MADGEPIRNSRVIGVRYASVGMICITSRIGDSSASSRLLRPAAMPSGRPIASAIRTAASTTASVAMLVVPQPQDAEGREPETRQQRQPPAAEQQAEGADEADDAGPAERREELVEQVRRAHVDADPDRVEDRWRLVGRPTSLTLVEAAKIAASSSWGSVHWSWNRM